VWGLRPGADTHSSRQEGKAVIDHVFREGPAIGILAGCRIETQHVRLASLSIAAMLPRACNCRMPSRCTNYRATAGR
jgi:hypothetical protein